MGMGYPPLASQPPPNHTHTCIQAKGSNKKCNMMLSCDKSLCIVLDYWIAFMVHKNAQANFTNARLNVTKHLQDSKFGPPPCENSRLLGDLVLATCTSTSP